MRVGRVWHKHKINHLGEDNAWPLKDVLAKLIEATDILLHEKDYDGQGWEEIEICLNKGREYLEIIKKQ